MEILLVMGMLLLKLSVCDILIMTRCWSNLINTEISLNMKLGYTANLNFI